MVRMSASSTDGIVIHARDGFDVEAIGLVGHPQRPLVVVPVVQVAFNVVNEFSESHRGDAGFGSTGQH